jgi:hypothetical protein
MARLGQRLASAPDPYSSADVFDGWSAGPPPRSPRITSVPRSWLLAVGWRTRGLVSMEEVPARTE